MIVDRGTLPVAEDGWIGSDYLFSAHRWGLKRSGPGKGSRLFWEDQKLSAGHKVNPPVENILDIDHLVPTPM